MKSTARKRSSPTPSLRGNFPIKCKESEDTLFHANCKDLGLLSQGGSRVRGVAGWLDVVAAKLRQNVLGLSVGSDRILSRIQFFSEILHRVGIDQIFDSLRLILNFGAQVAATCGLVPPAPGISAQTTVIRL